ncbi:hypothetical protein [Desulfofalx alkaliphila]|uniref:hypothetical protein n=1 Tax=Desulfofalx alkaliphila TaxID=105483 RepID=UPI0004E0B3CA|nr:hypothetical protein [Desulfofalx alkaliphila]
MTYKIDVDKFVKENQQQIEALVNASLNRAGKIVEEKVKAGELRPALQDIMPLMLYEILITNTVSTLRLAADMIEESKRELEGTEK